MKLTIDTKEDSKEELLRAIHLLQAAAGSQPTYSRMMDKAQHDVPGTLPEAGNIFSLFSQHDSKPAEPAREPDDEEEDEERTGESSYTIREEKNGVVQPEEIPKVVEYDMI